VPPPPPPQRPLSVLLRYLAGRNLAAGLYDVNTQEISTPTRSLLAHTRRIRLGLTSPSTKKQVPRNRL